MSDDWEHRLAGVWATIDERAPDDFVAAVDALAAERGPDDPDALFESGAARDSTGRSDEAVPRYERALELGLAGERRRRAVIQMASSLRNLGRAPESVTLLRAERERGSDHLDDAVAAFLALALADTGEEREAASLALEALAPHLPRYQRSLAAYARELSRTRG
jgi:tetratricopeptide (TPR) repeat protein